MTKEEFRKLTENILILDGATGSNLMASGMPRGICTETWVIDHKDIIQDLQRAYICLLYTSPSPRDYAAARMPAAA